MARCSQRGRALVFGGSCFPGALSSEAKCQGDGRDEGLQVSNRDRGQSNGLHAPICVNERVQLDLHLAGLRRMKHSFVMVSFDILLHEESQLKRQS